MNSSGLSGGNEDSIPLGLSTNGQFALFESTAGDLVPGDTNNASDVFERDVVNGTTILVSVNTNGAAGNGPSGDACFTPDGRYVAFVSQASDLVSGDTNRLQDVFVRDLVAGNTVLASVGAVTTNKSTLMSSSEAPEISADGRYVAFYSSATNLISGVPPGGDIYIRDLDAGMMIWASQSARAAAFTAFGRSNVVSYNHRLSSDGQFVVYESSLGNQSGANFTNAGLILRFSLSSGLTDVVYSNAEIQFTPFQDAPSIDMTPDGKLIAFIANTNGNSGETTFVAVWNALNGSLKLASGDTNGLVATNSTCRRPVLDAGGRFVTFLSNAPGLVTNSIPGEFHLYQNDPQSGATILVDADINGVGSPLASETTPAVSADGLVIAFSCADAQLVPNENDHTAQMFVPNMATGMTELISAHSPSWDSRTPSASSTMTLNSISADGRFFALSSDADDLVAGDTNRCRDVFVRDLAFGTNSLVSVDTNGAAADGSSTEPVLTPDGRYVAFSSFADDLVLDDTNQAFDIFVRDLETGITTLESRGNTGAVGNGPSSSPQISTDAGYILFRSWAKNLVPGIVNYENLFLRDRQTGTNYALTVNGANLASMTPDGRFVAFIAASRWVMASNLNVWDSRAATLTYASPGISGSPLNSIAIRGDGKMVAYAAAGGLYVLDLATTNTQLLDASAFSYQQLRFSRDGGCLAYSSLADTNAASQVYLLDLRTGTPLLVSHGLLIAGPANAVSDSPDISTDDRFVAYRSSSTDLIQALANSNGVPNIFIFDRLTGSNSLLSVSKSGNAYANNRSIAPIFTADGHTLFFTSWADDLAAQDFNRSMDLFAFTFFYASIAPESPPGSGNIVSWPYLAGRSYQVQFKSNLPDSNWQTLNGGITNYGNRAWWVDPAPQAQRFYRIISF